LRRGKPQNKKPLGVENLRVFLWIKKTYEKERDTKLYG